MPSRSYEYCEYRGRTEGEMDYILSKHPANVEEKTLREEAHRIAGKMGFYAKKERDAFTRAYLETVRGA